MTNVFCSDDYLELEAGRVGGVPVRSKPHEGFEFSLIKRPIPGTGHFDGTSVYGYGEINRGRPGVNIDKKQMHFFAEECRNAGLVSAFFRLAPGQTIDLPEDVCAAVQKIGPTVAVDLQLSWTEIFQSFRPRLRSQLRGSQGLTFEESDSAATFHEIYTENMARLGAEAHYFFSRDYIEALLKINGVCLLLASDAHGPVSGAITFQHNGNVYYHLGATSDRGLTVSPLKNVLAKLIEINAGGPFRKLFLGGGLGGENDTLLRFKRGFSKDMLDTSMLKIVFDKDAYAELSMQNSREICFAGFFPHYRKPTK